MINIIHNKINSNYFIINIKLDKLSNIFINNKNNKHKYFIIIKKWIKSILDKYSIMSNWVVYIKNLNYCYFRIFIYLNSLNYSNMDEKNIIYLNDMINYENIFKINIKDFIKLFNADELKLFIDLEFKIIDNNFNSISSNNSNGSEEINTELNGEFTNSFDIIDLNFFNIDKLQNQKIISHKEFISSNKKYIITDIGISGLNKVTFFNELLKVLQLNNTDIYYDKEYNIYNDDLFSKIKENNKFYWIDYINNLENNESNMLSILFKLMFNGFQ